MDRFFYVATVNSESLHGLFTCLSRTIVTVVMVPLAEKDTNLNLYGKIWLVVLRLNVPVNNFSVMSGRILR